MKLLSTVLFILIFSQKTLAAVSAEQAESLFNIFSSIYKLELENKGQSLIFNPKFPGSTMTNFDIDLVHASYTWDTNVHYVNVFGGLINLEKLTVDGLAVILCHELGHGLGGEPLKNNGFSTEGQSDYFATSNCLLRIFANLPAQNFELLPIDVNKYCESDAHCLRGMAAIRDGILILPINDLRSSDDLVGSENFVTEIVDRSDSFYPTRQCRIQTLRNGLMNLPRPSCWFR